jgi:hypothetical protein
MTNLKNGSVTGWRFHDNSNCCGEATRALVTISRYNLNNVTRYCGKALREMYNTSHIAPIYADLCPSHID